MPSEPALNVGSRKQLFFDDLLVEHSRGMVRAMNPPVQHPEPVLVPDKPWEARGIGGYNTVLREPDGRFRMWYAAAMLGGLPQEGAIRLCYAESQDGLRWEKPSLGLLPFRGSKDNNVVAPPLERQSQQGATVLRDARAPAEERYKLLTKFRVTDDEMAAGARNGLYALHSPDGLRWRLYPDQPCSPVMCDTQNMCFWDDRIGLYVAYTRVRETQHVDEAAKAEGKKGFRCVGRMTSPDFRAWSEQEIVFQADDEDLSAPLPAPSGERPHPVDFYTSCAMKYEQAQDAYFMFPSAYYHWKEDEAPATMDVRLLASRDGVRWTPQGGRKPFLRQGPDGSPTSGMLFANPWLIPVGDELWLYCMGTDRRHNDKGGTSQSGVFRASMRMDGFVSLDAGYGGGEFATPPVVFDGRRLELNFDGSAGGWAKAEIQDESGRPLPGFSLDDCEPVLGNAVRKGVRWSGGDLSKAAGRPVRLRFFMRDAKLYAMQFVGA